MASTQRWSAGPAIWALVLAWAPLAFAQEHWVATWAAAPQETRAFAARPPAAPTSPLPQGTNFPPPPPPRAYLSRAAGYKHSPARTPAADHELSESDRAHDPADQHRRPPPARGAIERFRNQAAHGRSRARGPA